MQKIIVAFVLVLVACTSRPPAAPPADQPRAAIDVKYVGVPEMNIYAEPSETSPVVTTYGYTETVSILSKKGDWVEVRTVDGSGWAKASGFIGGAEVQAVLANPTPKFATPPVAVPDNRAHGDIAIMAKVNTDGDVVEAWMLKNTTASKQLVDANIAALKQAKFYPIIQKGQRLTFTYEYDVTY